ncbi:hypothetical protein AAIR98_000858 [Elusimicrobium simillimum]|uniref:hypothetical protein n=1 Tax=Elusimicrobium simillimum TaxID=3143438 RepID=UPI003C6F14A9
MPKEIRAYKCNFCRRVFVTPPAARLHEHYCYKNKEKYGDCRACVHYATKQSEFDDRWHYYCKKRDMWILSPKAAKNALDYNARHYGKFSAPPLNCKDRERLIFPLQKIPI